MKNNTLRKFVSFLGSLWLVLAAAGPQAADAPISQVPLFLSAIPGKPNIMLMVDDSGSMSGSVMVNNVSQGSRISIARTAAKGLVDQLGTSAAVRLGLATYGDDSCNTPTGGKLLRAVADLDSTQAGLIKSDIGNLTANGCTPLATTLSDIGYYFATGNTTGNLTLHPGAATPQPAAMTTIFGRSDGRTPGLAGFTPTTLVACEITTSGLTPDQMPAGYTPPCPCSSGNFVSGGAGTKLAAQDTTAYPPVQLIVTNSRPTLCTAASAPYCTMSNTFGTCGCGGLGTCGCTDNLSGTPETINFVRYYSPPASLTASGSDTVKAYLIPDNNPSNINIAFRPAAGSRCNVQEFSYSDYYYPNASRGATITGTGNGTCRLCTTFPGTSTTSCTYANSGTSCTAGNQECISPNDWNDSSCSSTSDTYVSAWNNDQCTSAGQCIGSVVSGHCEGTVCAATATNACECLTPALTPRQCFHAGDTWAGAWNHTGSDALGNSCGAANQPWCNTASRHCAAYGSACAYQCAAHSTQSCAWNYTSYDKRSGYTNNTCANQGAGYRICTSVYRGYCSGWLTCAWTPAGTDALTGLRCAAVGQSFCSARVWNHTGTDAESHACQAVGQQWCSTLDTQWSCDSFGSPCSRPSGTCRSATPNDCNCTTTPRTACAFVQSDITVGSGGNVDCNSVPFDDTIGGAVDPRTKCFDPAKYYTVQYSGTTDILGPFTGAQFNWYFAQPGFRDGSFILPQTTSTGLCPVSNAPIRNWCQKNFAILVSDGLPNYDRTVSETLSNYRGQCCTDATGCVTNRTCDARPNLNIAMPGTNVALTGSGTACTSTGRTSTSTTGGTNNMFCQNGSKVGRKYETGGSDYLDDVAQALFEMDLRPDLGVNEKSTANSRNNLVTYAIGFADPSLNPATASSVLGDAALVGGGKFFYAQDTTELSAAIKSVLTEISSQAGSSAAVATNSTKVSGTSLVYQAMFDSHDWFGDLKAIPIAGATATGLLTTAALWNAGTLIPNDGALTGNVYNAGRTILTYNLSGTGTSKGIPFTCDNLSAAQKTGLGIVGVCSSTTDRGVLRLNWLRGDKSHEVINPERVLSGDSETRSTDLAVAIFRNRTRLDPQTKVATGPDPWLLGDIVNSNPLYVGEADYGYGVLTGASGAEGTTYSAHVTASKSRRPMVYVGANDGMLHGFDAASSGVTMGKEQVAYLPDAVYDGNLNLQNLSSTSYSHRYLVDGSPVAGDAYFAGAWHTVLVATTGAGARAAFALDVTNPGAAGSTSNFDGGKVLWEISTTQAASSGDLTTDTPGVSGKRGFTNNLGYTLSQPAIVRLHDGSWAAIIANGYESANNLAVLYILNVADGSIIRTLTAVNTNESGFDPAAAHYLNGLSTPFVADVDGDMIAEYIYAGDLRGNLWKFDVTGQTAASWGVANSGNPLYVACDMDLPVPCGQAHRQPITGRPVVGSASPVHSGSYMVYFGTGRYFATGDNDLASPQTQTFYGIWDADNGSVVPSPVVASSTGSRSNLVGQTIDTVTTVSGNTWRTTSDNACAGQGWFMDLLDPPSGGGSRTPTGERVTAFPQLRGDRLLFTTLLPLAVDPGAAACSTVSSGTGWLMELAAICGAPVSSTLPPWDVNGDQTIDSRDTFTVNGATVAPAGMKSIVGIPTAPAIVRSVTSGLETKYIAGSTGQIQGIMETYSTTGGGTGRQSWSQIR